MPAPLFVYVDETKAPDFHLVATLVQAPEVAKVKAMLLDRLRPNQRRIHFRDENQNARRDHLAVMRGLPVRSWVYSPAAGSARRQTAQRSATLNRLVDDVARVGDARIYIETDTSRLSEDQRVLRSATKRWADRSDVTFCHVDPKDEPALWISDAVAWCWTKPGSWRDAVTPLVERNIEL